MTLRVAMPVHVAHAMLSVAIWLTATSGATMAQPLEGLLDIQQGDCSSAGANYTQLAAGYRQTHDACYLRHFDGEGPSWLGSSMSSACVEIGSTFAECLVQAGDYCRALRARDREIAACMAREEARQMARLSEERTRLQGVDEAFSATGDLNDMRTRDGNPATEISAGLTGHALDMLGDRTTRTLDAFTEAFQAFDRSEAGQSFLEQYVQDRAFIPGASNSAPPLEPGAIPPEVQELLNLAAEIAERDYSLPVGRDSTLSPEGQQWFQEAVQAALDGDPSMLLSAGDAGLLATLRLERLETTREEGSPSFDRGSAIPAAPDMAGSLDNAPAQTEDAAPPVASVQPSPTPQNQGTGFELTRWPVCFERFLFDGQPSFRSRCDENVFGYFRSQFTGGMFQIGSWHTANNRGQGYYVQNDTEGPDTIYCIGDLEACNTAIDGLNAR